MMLLSRPASSQSLHGSYPSGPPPVPSFLPPVGTIPGDVSMYHMPLPQGSSGGPMMAITPPTPAAPKSKGKQPEQSDGATVSQPSGETPADSPDTPPKNTGSSPGSTGSLSKSAQAELEKLFHKIGELIAEASENTQLPADRITKFLGKRLGLTVRGSTSWNDYQTYFSANMNKELQGIGAEEEYANATAAQKPAIIARAHAAFKTKHQENDEWQTILQVWDTLKTVKKGCAGQTIGTRGNLFDAMNRKVAAFVSVFVLNEDPILTTDRIAGQSSAPKWLGIHLRCMRLTKK